MYVARDKNGLLTLFSAKPILHENKSEWISEEGAPEVFIDPEGPYDCMPLEDTLYPEITFENSPIELTLNIK